jgi:L-lactate dehydrogenase complex protein LldE
MTAQAPRVGLFVTCLVDLIRPSVGFAAVKLLEDAGCRVDVPQAQTCCGQPAYNSGDRRDAIAIARQVIAAFGDFDYVVVPSGSCGGMIAKHYPELFAEGSPGRAQAEALAAKTHELVSFLVHVMKIAKVDAQFAARATYHDSCSGLRELGIKQEPRQLLASVEGVSLREMADAEVCCGFGGTFCVKYPSISDKMLEKKLKNIAATGADTLIAGDLGCLMNLAGKLKRQGSAIKVRHVAEVLAGDMATPPIAEAG